MNLPDVKTGAQVTRATSDSTLVLGRRIGVAAGVLLVVVGGVGIAGLLPKPVPLPVSIGLACWGLLGAAAHGRWLHRFSKTGQVDANPARFALSTLLMVVTLACIFFASFGWQRRADAEQAAARQHIKQAIMNIIGQGTVSETGYPDRWSVEVTGQSFSDSKLQDLLALTHSDLLADQDITVGHIVLIDCNVTDSGVRVLCRWRGLESLALYQTAISDTGIAELARCESLEILACQGAGITEEGVELLKQQRPELEVTWTPDVGNP